jgi:hypothetical protein
MEAKCMHVKQSKRDVNGKCATRKREVCKQSRKKMNANNKPRRQSRTYLCGGPFTCRSLNKPGTSCCNALKIDTLSSSNTCRASIAKPNLQD